MPENRVLTALRQSPWLRPVAVLAALVAVFVTVEAVVQPGFDTALQAAVLWAVAAFLAYAALGSAAPRE